MVGKHIDTVFVDVLPDVSAFAANAEKDLKKSLKSAERAVEKSAEKMEDSFKDSFGAIDREASKALSDLDRQLDSFAAAQERHFQDLDKAVEKSFGAARKKITEEIPPLDIPLTVSNESINKFTRDTNGRLRDSRGKFVPAGTEIGGGIIDGISSSVQKGAVGVVGNLSVGLSQASGPLAAVAAGLGAILAGGIAPAIGGLAASIPGLIGVAAVSIGTLTLAFQGFDEALKNVDDVEKFNEALKNLSPSARDIAKELRDLIPKFKDIRKAAQEGLFAGTSGQLTQLINTLQGPLKEGFKDVGVALQLVGKEVVGFFASAKGVELINEIFKSTSIIIAGMSQAIKPLATGISDLVIASLPFIEKLSLAFGTFLQSVGEKLTALTESGTLDEFFSSAFEALVKIGQIVEDIFPILIGLFAALMPAGLDFLDLIGRLTEELAVFLSDKDNVAALAAAFQILGFALTINLELFTLAADAGRALGEIFKGLTGATDGTTKAVANFGQQSVAWMGAATQSVMGVVGAISNAPAMLASLGGRFYSAGLSLIRSFFAGLSSAGSFAGNLASSVYGALRSGLNSAIGRINGAIGRISAALPGFSIPGIPMVAQGGVTDGPTLAGIGEAGTEAVFPLTGTQGRKAMDLLSEAFARTQGAMNPGASTGAVGDAPGVRMWGAQAENSPTLVQLVVDSAGTALDDLIVEVISKVVRDRGGNPVQVFGGSRFAGGTL